MKRVISLLVTTVLPCACLFGCTTEKTAERVGYPRLFIDYKDFYLIVSDNATGVHENTPPIISAIWCYWESVYSAYDNDGNLIFRTSVDCSPDYDSIEAKITSP